MSESSLYLWSNNNHLGPWTEKEIKTKINNGELAYTDYVWLDDESSWTMLANFFCDDFPPPKEAPPALKQAGEPKLKLKKFDQQAFEGGAGISNEPIWFLYQKGQKLGPYRFLELVQLLQKNSCSREDFIWKPGFEDWQRINAVYEFNREILEKLKDFKDGSKLGLENVFIKRRFPRVPYDTEVIIHDNTTVLFGEARSLSEGGAFINVQTPSHKKGERLKLHFTPGGVETPFNCIAEIISTTKGDNPGYTVKFIYLEEADRKRVAAYAKAIDGK